MKFESGKASWYVGVQGPVEANTAHTFVAAFVSTLHPSPPMF